MILLLSFDMETSEIYERNSLETICSYSGVNSATIVTISRSTLKLCASIT